MAARAHFRAHARRRVDLDAALRARDGGFACDARVRDLGLGGACIEIADAGGGVPGVEREAPVSLEVMAPTLWDPLVLGGRIAWVRRTGPLYDSGSGQRPPTRSLRVGVRFEHRDSPALYALFQLLGAHIYDT